MQKLTKVLLLTMMAILTYILSSCSLVSKILISNMKEICTNNTSRKKNYKSTILNDENNDTDLYFDLTEDMVTNVDSLKIKNTYYKMCDNFNNDVKETSNKKGSIKKLNNSNDFNNSPILLLSNKNNNDKEMLEIDEYMDNIIQDFYILKNEVGNDFEKYCNDYAIFNENILIRVRINESLQELELSIRRDNLYIFFSSYYLDDDFQKHVDYQEGYELYVTFNIFTYTVKNNKIAFPITYCSKCNDARNIYLLSSEEDYEMMDVTEAYDTLKYPYVKHIDSKLIQTLVNSSSQTIDGEKQFRKAVDKTIFNFNYIGEFLPNGANYSGETLTGTVDDNILTLSLSEYHVKTVASNIFYLGKGGLYISISWCTVKREKVETGIKQVQKSKTYYYCISKSLHKDDEGIYFKLNEIIDLNNPQYTYEYENEDIVGDSNSVVEIEYQEFSNIEENGNVNLMVEYVYFRSNGEFFSIVGFLNKKI